MVANRVAHILITFGGIATIAAVSMVCVFLVWVVVPIFLPADVALDRQVPSPVADSGPVQLRVNEYMTTGWSLGATGAVHVFRLDNGEQLSGFRAFAERAPTAGR